MIETIHYTSGCKYQLHEDYSLTLPFPVPEIRGKHDYIFIYQNRITIFKGYAWDGPSGPTIDSKDFMRGSLVHDAGYDLMEIGALPWSLRDSFDNLLKSICLEDGMPFFRAEYVFMAVRAFGRIHSGLNPEVVYSAP